ncbi:CAAD domain-containing protein [Lyngbya sp. CCY1209]|uniref:CAAD domain-containing protein n=1 Tax=Lyngbya sp. CCY1209 TaxID=2886103 RepID=UPI002D213CC9|nr:CAAD domain-containing protein [Lyngbya sp. CCY1209]MEB3886644.1 hypothetical protein [Lyngbya sp. CCY1209]
MADSKSKPENDKTTPTTNSPAAQKPASNPEPTPAKPTTSGTANKMEPPAKPEPQPEPVAAKPAEPKPEPVAAAKPPEPKPEPVAAAKPPEPPLEPATEPKAAIAETTTGTPETAATDVAAITDRVMAFIANLPQIFGQFFGEYSRPLTTVILIVVLLVTLRVLVGVIDIINTIPFVQPTLELVGIGFSAWFVYRYLLRSETRQELVTQFNALKAEVLGEES